MNKEYPYVEITIEMIEEAKRLEQAVRVKRTRASYLDTLAGILGEFVFAQWLFGDWRKHRVARNKGQVDYSDVGVEVKTSAFPLNPNLHLLVREDYAVSRNPSYYVQIIIDVETPKADKVTPGTKAYLVGWATSEEVSRAEKRDMGTKTGKDKAGYKCHAIPISRLHPMGQLRARLGVV